MMFTDVRIEPSYCSDADTTTKYYRFCTLSLTILAKRA
jgi:hypothetical protein